MRNFLVNAEDILQLLDKEIEYHLKMKEKVQMEPARSLQDGFILGLKHCQYLIYAADHAIREDDANAFGK